jgi:purine-cytosine permease-like protein
VAATIDGVLMIVGTIYIVWVADSFLGIFIAFLIVLGVPMAAWCGIFLADLTVRRRDYDELKLFDASGAGYGGVNPVAVVVMAVATLVGWGLVVDTTGAGKGLSWLGFLLGPLGLGGRDGAWAFANLGVPVALAVGFLGYVGLQAGAVRRGESAGIASRHG